MKHRFPWVFTVMWLAILLVMLWAGFWQLGRAEEKTAIKIKMAAKQSNQPKTIKDWQELSAFDAVTTTGQYRNVHFFLDNQITAGQVGYFVFTAFETAEGLLLLVNRGWVNDVQTDVSLETSVELKAMLADWPRPGIQLGEQVLNNQANQLVTYLPQKATVELLKSRLCAQRVAKNCIILPRVLKLDPAMPHGFKRQWQLPRMTAEKHRAYAIQWFTMSLVLCLIFVVFIKKTYFNNRHASKN